MSDNEDWLAAPIAELFESTIPGEWGLEGGAESGVPVLRSTNFCNNGFLDFSKIVFRKLEQWQLSKRRVSSGTLLIEKSGGSPTQPAGRVVFCDQEFDGTASNFIEIVKIKAAHSPRYVAYLLYSLYHAGLVNKYQQQTTGIINFKLYQYFREIIKIPPLPQQRRIAEILSTVDDAIEATEALIAKQQQIKQGLMHDLFTRGVWTAESIARAQQAGSPAAASAKPGQLRPCRETAPELYQESPLGCIPKDWEVGHLSDKKREGTPHLKTGPFGSSLKLEHWVQDGWPVITIGALGEGVFNESDLLYVSEQTAARLIAFQMNVGDVVFSRVADVGRSTVVTSDEAGWIMSANLMRISLDRFKVKPQFLQMQLAHYSKLRTQIRCTVNSSGRDVANSETLNRLYFVWPDVAEQESFLNLINGVSDQITALRDQCGKLNKQKQGLMQDLLTGRVSV
jgi:type I restriction enzyme S subunit